MIGVGDTAFVKKLRKTMWYSRLRQRFPALPREPIDDRGRMPEAERVWMQWPAHLPRPRVGVVPDFEVSPLWTKYCRFLETNGFPYTLCQLHARDWLERAKSFDIVVGFVSSEWSRLEEMREKYFFLERYLGKATYPSPEHALLYEDKRLQVYLARTFDLPYVETHVTHDAEEAFRLVEQLPLPFVSKMVPGSGSVGVELVRTRELGRRIVEQSFSPQGRKSHWHYVRQKDTVYFQRYVPNDGYDLRVIVVANWVFGYYRKVLEGDFRASGMGMVEKRALPEEAMRIARLVNEVVHSPMLVVDFVHGLDGRYWIVEFSPVCQMDFPEQLHVDGVPGVYVFDPDGSYRFQAGKYWVHELALREFLRRDYLPRVSPPAVPVEVQPASV